MQDTILNRPRIAIYARYSSTLQKPSSIEDQVRLCEERAQSLGGVIVRVHSDFHATASTGQSQPALETLLLDAKRGFVDVVFAEALDRISRDQEHIHGIHKRLLYWKVRLFTLHEGEIQSIHISIGGYMNSAFLENLRAKTKRGQIGAVRAGRIPGGLCYGYSVANRMDEQGRPIRGLREIQPDEAAVIQRIYRAYADGDSVRTITAALNREGVPGPRGRLWGPTTINGHRARRNGILNNELYHGVHIYGRQEFVRDPDTGKRQARPVPRDQWTVEDLPALRIVDDTLWQQVQTRRQAGQDRRRSPAHHTPLPLTGVVRCGSCGGSMTIVKQRRYACHAHAQQGACANPRGIDATRLEAEACGLLALKIAHHKDPDNLIRRAASESQKRYRELSAQIKDRNKRIARLLAGIESGAHSLAAHKRIVEIERETASIEIERGSLPTIPGTASETLTQQLQERLATLSRAISENPPAAARRRHALVELARLIETIRINPLPGRGNLQIELTPRLDALVGLAIDPGWNFHTDATGSSS